MKQAFHQRRFKCGAMHNQSYNVVLSRGQFLVWDDEVFHRVLEQMENYKRHQNQ